MATGLQQAVLKMEKAGVNPAAINVFSYYYGQLAASRDSAGGGDGGLIPEDSIAPLTDVESIDKIEVDEQAAQQALSQTVLIKLNGGLGTSMGMDRAKSLLPVREGLSFLDIICHQVLAARKRYAVKLPIIFMNSFRTSADTLAVLRRYPDLPVDDLPLEFWQNQEPKLLSSSLEPVSWPQNPELEWCPPGHGDIYTALFGSGLLDQLIAAGYRYAMTSNADNLGSTPNAKIAGWFATSGAPYAAEVCTRTPNDSKGGHLAVRKSDGQVILRDTAQCPKADMHYFTDMYRHPYFHTNNLWFNLSDLRRVLRENDGVLQLPMIINEKTVDPADPSSPKVIQIETSMGTAVSVFPGATAIRVPRSRFLPVKTTNELFLIRSDLYQLDENYNLKLVADGVPEVSLDSRYYKTIGDFEQRFPQGMPSVINAEQFIVKGNWVFGRNISVKSRTVLSGNGGCVADNTVLS